MSHNAPLSRSERRRIDQALIRAAGPIPGFEALDGLFAALHTGPELVTPADVLRDVLRDRSGHSVFASIGDAQDVLPLLVRHWNAVGTALRTMDPYEPPLATGAKRGASSSDWATGYGAGVSMRSASWYAAAEQYHGIMYLDEILALAKGALTEPKLQQRLETTGFDQVREARILTLGYNVTLLYRLLAPARGEPVIPLGPDRGVAPSDLADRWEVGLMPLPVPLEENPEAEPLILAVVKESGMAHSQLLEDACTDAELARFVAREVVRCIALLGAPPLIWTRDDLLLGALAVIPELADCPVVYVERLPLLEVAEQRLMEGLLREARPTGKHAPGQGDRIRKPRK